MTGATYRIEVSHEPNSENDSLPYIARVYALADDHGSCASAWAPSPEEAVGRVRSWIAARSEAQPKQTYYTDDQGNYVENHSVRV